MQESYGLTQEQQQQQRLPYSSAALNQPLARRMYNRRDTYRLVFPLIALALLPALLNGSLSSFDRVGFPLLTGLLGFAALGLYWWRWSLRTLNAMLLLGAWAYLLGRVAFILFTLPDALHLSTVVNSLVWVPALLVSHQWMLGARAGRVATGVALVLLLGLFAIHVIDTPATLRGPEMNFLIQMIVASVVVLSGQYSAFMSERQARRAQPTEVHSAGRDALTGLPDQGAVEQILLQAQGRQLSGLVVAVVSLDHCERMQELHGEAFVEHLSAHVARVLCETVRDEDIVGCLGRAEFAVMMRVPDGRAAKAACERLRVRVASRPLEGVNPTVSIGVAFREGHAGGLELLREAQEALHDLQTEGFNRVLLSSKRQDQTNLTMAVA